MNRLDRKLWISRGKTAALILGLPVLLVLGELLRGYAALGSGNLGSGNFWSWAAQDLSEFAGAYAYLAVAVAVTAAVVGYAVKRASQRAISRARRRGVQIGRRRAQLELEELRGRTKIQAAAPRDLSAFASRATRTA